MSRRKITLYDTTLRDGSQAENITFSLSDMVRIALALDLFGIDYIEGGWPGSNPKHMDFFEAIRREKLGTSRIAAFGSTRHAKNTPSQDANLKALVDCKAPVVTIFGKSWDLHVTDALRVSLDENLSMIETSLAFLKKKVDTLFYDAEHFFDAYRANPSYALKTLEAAASGGAECLYLCDTNGGNLPSDIKTITETVRAHLPGIDLGIHTHNDSSMAEANALMAVEAGACSVQGTINGLGERCGNCDLTAIIPALELKMNCQTVGKKKLQRLTELSRYIYEVSNISILDRQPYVGRSAFAHKGGIHVSAVQRNSKTYEHIAPEAVGNERRILISELSGRSNIIARSKVDLTKDPAAMKRVLEEIMRLEHEGYQFESADASFDMLVQRTLGLYAPFFKLHGFRVISENNDETARNSEATVKLEVGGRLEHTACESHDGPVSALDGAIRKALIPHFPQLSEMRLVDYKVVIFNPQEATQAHVRVLIESADSTNVWRTVGASANIIEASYIALVDAIEYKLLLLSKHKPQKKQSAKKAAATKRVATKSKK